MQYSCYNLSFMWLPNSRAHKNEVSFYYFSPWALCLIVLFRYEPKTMIGADLTRRPSSLRFIFILFFLSVHVFISFTLILLKPVKPRSVFSLANTITAKVSCSAKANHNTLQRTRVLMLLFLMWCFYFFFHFLNVFVNVKLKDFFINIYKPLKFCCKFG